MNFSLPMVSHGWFLGKTQRIWTTLREGGAVETTHLVGYRVLERLASYTALVGLTARLDDLPYPEDIGEGLDYRLDFLQEEELRRFAANPDNDLTEAFLRHAQERGDRCFGVVDGDTLASYSWYTSAPTPTKDLMLHFDPRYVHAYKAYTLPRYRGQRLHSISKTLALRALGSTYEGVISFAQSWNYRSIRSNQRMGLKPFGITHVACVGGHTVILSTAGCADYAFWVHAAPR